MNNPKHTEHPDGAAEALKSRARRLEDIEYMSEVDAALHRRGHPYAYMLSVGVLAFFFCFGVWASLAEVDEVTRGQGQVVPSQRIQEIQYYEGGVLAEMLVKEGQKVAKDEILARISNQTIVSSREDAENRKIDHEANILRLEAELNGVEPAFPADLAQKYPQVVEGQKALYRANKQRYEGEIQTSEAKIEQRKGEVEETLSTRRALEARLNISIQQRDTLRPLVAKGVYSKVDFLRTEQQVAELRGQLETIIQTISRSRSAVAEAEAMLENRRNELRSAMQEDINKRRAEIKSIDTMLTAGIDRVARTELRSPVNGLVKRILLNTPGGSVKSGETVLEILPIDETLLLEAKIKPTDRAFLHEQQSAVVKISAYDFSIYGGLDATVESISADTIEDKRGDSYYEVRLRTKTNTLKYRDALLPILPGMTASVDILTGKKTVLEYLLKPLFKAKQNALRER